MTKREACAGGFGDGVLGLGHIAVTGVPPSWGWARRANFYSGKYNEFRCVGLGGFSPGGKKADREPVGNGQQ